VINLKKNLIVLLILACFILSACGSSKSEVTLPQKKTQPPTSKIVAEPAVVEKPQFTRDNYPKVDGSTATIPLSEDIAAAILGLSKTQASEFIKHNTTHDAYVNLIKGNADIIFVTEPSAAELKIAKDANIELEIIPIVKEGFVFLVNSRNKVESLTTKQIQDIYQGKITNWKEVGGSDSELVPFQRESNSGSQTLMEQIVMKGATLMHSPKTIISSMSGLIDAIAAYDNSEKALGYSVYYYAKQMYNKDTIKLIAVDGVIPDNKNISSGKYPFTTGYYAVLKKSSPADAPSRKLLKWILGKDGQTLAEKSGYVPLVMR
jgi:phosphate transport system substrate-binding protein